MEKICAALGGPRINSKQLLTVDRYSGSRRRQHRDTGPHLHQLACIVQELLSVLGVNSVEIIDHDPAAPDRVSADGICDHRFETTGDLPGAQPYRDLGFRVLACSLEPFL
ncbi:MAG: hypothetical protein ACRDTF_04015, partial [Pseudonocardiaceae bacterium]